MKQILALLLTAVTLSFAACTKSDNTNSIRPISPYLDQAYFKGDLNDARLTVTSFDGYAISLIYKGMYFSGTAMGEGITGYKISVSNGHTTATGKLQVPIYYLYNGQVNFNYAKTCLMFDPGSIFESRRYNLVN